MSGLGRCVVAGGEGAVGRMVAGLLADGGGTVVTVDPRARTPALRGDVTDPDRRLLDELAVADVVVLAVPEPVALAALPVLVRSLRPGALLVDTLSVKGPYVAAARRAGAGSAGIEVLGLNPMFAPSLPLRGRPVAAVAVFDGPRARRLRELLARAGGRVVPMSAAEHDRLAAATQALTHAAVLAFGLALAELDVDIDRLAEIAPPPHVTMLGLLARITAGTPDVYWDVQAANAYAGSARSALARSARELAELFAHPRAEKEFTELLGRLRELLGPQAQHHSALCARMFVALAEA